VRSRRRSGIDARHVLSTKLKVTASRDIGAKPKAAGLLCDLPSQLRTRLRRKENP
jgi:hypothetical protein